MDQSDAGLHVHLFQQHQDIFNVADCIASITLMIEPEGTRFILKCTYKAFCELSHTICDYAFVQRQLETLQQVNFPIPA